MKKKDAQPRELTNSDSILLRAMASEEQDPIDRDLLRRRIHSVLSRLPDDERMMVELRFGLADGNALPYAEIARRMEIGVDDVRKRFAQVLRKLQFPHTKRMLDFS